MTSKMFSYHWPYGIVPYTISDDFDDEERANVLLGFEEYHKEVRDGRLCFGIDRQKSGVAIQVGSCFNVEI